MKRQRYTFGGIREMAEGVKRTITGQFEIYLEDNNLVIGIMRDGDVRRQRGLIGQFTPTRAAFLKHDGECCFWFYDLSKDEEDAGNFLGKYTGKHCFNPCLHVNEVYRKIKDGDFFKLIESLRKTPDLVNVSLRVRLFEK